VVASHIEAGRLAMAMGIPAVTIEPAARAVGAAFHPIEVHSAQLWVAETWIGDDVVEAAMTILMGSRFQRQLAGVGGYDLEGSGVRAA
jgi:molybdate-binding protein